MLLRDETLAGRIREAVTNTQQATADLGHASSEAAALMTDLRSRDIPQKTGEIMDHLTDSARQVHQVVSDIAKPDQQGMSAAANIRESLMNASTATANLADASEALKHNFFTRGFFKDRGYYSLADLSPEKYRHDRTFTSRAQNRVWLSGSDLFQHGSDGEEELSANGKTLLDDTFNEHGDSKVESPIVVEGYFDGDIPTDRLRLSRRRSDLCS